MRGKGKNLLLGGSKPKKSESTRMNGHYSSSNNPKNVPLPIATHTRSRQLPPL